MNFSPKIRKNMKNMLKNSRRNPCFHKLQLRHLRLEIIFTFSYGFGIFEDYFLIKPFPIKKRANVLGKASLKP